MKLFFTIILILILNGISFCQEETEFLRIGSAKDFEAYLNENSCFKISGATALFIAAKLNENEKAILFLYDKYYKMDSLNLNDIESLLFISITKNKRKLFKRVLKYPEFDANKVLGFRDYPIFFALFANNKYYVVKLLEAGADINIITTINTKFTPLQYTIATNRFILFKTIIKNEADIYKSYEGNNKSAIEFLFEIRRNHNSYYKMELDRYPSPFDDRIVDLFLKKYSKPFTDNEKKILLEYSIMEANMKVFRKVLNEFSVDDLVKLDEKVGKLICRLALENPKKKYYKCLNKIGFECASN